MAEKRGNLIKLEYDFNPAWACEIYLNGKWMRVLERDFRSYNGQRRITKPTVTELGNVRVFTDTYIYEGPYYYHGTNMFFNPEEHPKDTIIFPIGNVRPQAQRTSVAKI